MPGTRTTLKQSEKAANVQTETLKELQKAWTTTAKEMRTKCHFQIRCSHHEASWQVWCSRLWWQISTTAVLPKWPQVAVSHTPALSLLNWKILNWIFFDIYVGLSITSYGNDEYGIFIAHQLTNFPQSKTELHPPTWTCLPSNSVVYQRLTQNSGVDRMACLQSSP